MLRTINNCYIVHLFIYLFLSLSEVLTFANEINIKTGIIPQHASWNLGHNMVNPTVFNGMWVYLPFCSSPTTKPEIWPLHVTRKQTIIHVIYERRKRRLRKRWGKERKEVTAKERDFFQSPCYSLMTLHSMVIDSCLKWYISPDFPPNNGSG